MYLVEYRGNINSKATENNTNPVNNIPKSNSNSEFRVINRILTTDNAKKIGITTRSSK